MAALKRIHVLLVAGCAIAAAVGLSGRVQAQDLTIGTIGASSDAPLFIADAMGYYAEQGLKVSFVRFDSAAKMIPSLGSGEVDVGSGATSAGLYNAVARGIPIKIVSDKARNAKGYGFQAIMIRTDLLDSGKVKSLKDFKGLKVAMSANGNSENAIVNYALVQNGLSYSDIDPVFLGFPNQIAAFANKAIDASLTVEPTVSELLKLGTAKKLVTIDEVFPNFQTAVIFYSPKFVQDQPDNAKKFMVALVKAIRFYDDALKDGHIAGPNADQVIKILTQYSFIKDPAVHRAIISQAIDPDGQLDIPSLQMAWQFFKDTKQIDGSVKVDDVVDLSYVHAASKALGPYVKKSAMQ
ncbi:MAG TPA: ABC transporter substrate-binding protein [Xanthobacteraceae bacterium]|nr:ABC transporter substrate-binding protein [Xanthobacteraceae bacterium]